MKGDQKKKEGEKNTPTRTPRQSLFSVPVILAIIVACLAAFFGSFLYTNKTTELQQEYTTPDKNLDLDDEYHTATPDVQDEQRQDSVYSAVTQPSTEATISHKAKNIDNSDTKKIFTSTDVEKTEIMVDLDQSERENPTTHQTPSSGLNSFNQERKTLKPTDKETLASTERQIDERLESLGANEKSGSPTAEKKSEPVLTEPEDKEKEMRSPSSEVDHKTPEDDSRSSNNGKQIAEDDGEEKLKILPRLEGVKVGHVQNLELEPGKFYDVITRSLHPPIFEIPDFLVEHECQKLMDQATELGLTTSQLYVQSDVNSEPTNQETFKRWDYDDDDVITPQEVAYTLQDTLYMFFAIADIDKMFVDLDIDHNGNGVMDLDEYLRVTNIRILRYLLDLSKTLPRTMHRNSKHTWLHYNNLEGLNRRVSTLTKLPVEVVERSEKLQVVNYGPEGHYYCHIDSQDIEEGLPCCLANDPGKCRLCRYITVLYFLNDVEEGGETAFPVADNETFSYEEWAINMKHYCDLGKHCHQANVYVKPRQGTAIMWYNHLRDEQTGWLGTIDPRSYHGGCDVIKGHKWIANSWINIVGDSGDTLATYHPLGDPIP